MALGLPHYCKEHTVAPTTEQLHRFREPFFETFNSGWWLGTFGLFFHILGMS